MVGSLAPNNMNGFNINEMIKTIWLTTNHYKIGIQKAIKTQKYKI
jgi:hypothetical protein